MIRRNAAGGCYGCKSSEGGWVAFDVPVSETGVNGGETHYWDMVLCSEHVESVRLQLMSEKVLLIGPGVLVMEEGW